MDIKKPKYQLLKEYIMDIIKSQALKHGAQIFSENEMAEKFGISRHTVRQAIGELVNEGWLYRVQGKGTFVYRGPDQPRKPCRTIAIMTACLNDYIFPAIIMGVNNVLPVNEYSIILCCTSNDYEKEKNCLEAVKNQNIDALIVEPTKSALTNPNLDLYRELSSEGIPILFVNGYYKDLNYSYIIEDDVLGGYLATKHLIDLGHTNIAGIFKIDDTQGHFRFEGFQKAHKEVGIAAKDARVVWCDTRETDEKLSFNVNVRLGALVNECTAVVCYNDQLAMKMMDVIRASGKKISDDFSIVSFDDSQLAVVSEVKLTTVAHPKENLGEEAAKAAIGMIDRTQNHYNIMIKPMLIVRGSSKKYNNEKVEDLYRGF